MNQTRKTNCCCVPQSITIGEAFAVYDEQDRLVICNETVPGVLCRISPGHQPGRTFEGIIRYGIAHGQYADAVGREEDWIAGEARSSTGTGNAERRNLAMARWLQVQERKDTA